MALCAVLMCACVGGGHGFGGDSAAKPGEKSVDFMGLGDTESVDLGSLRKALKSCPPSMRNLSIDTLFNRGVAYTLRQPVQPDSAMICYMAVIQRLDTVTNRADMLSIAKSCINVAHVYTTVYKQTGHAYQYLRLAEKICLANDFNDIIPYVYLNMGVNVSGEEKLKSSYVPGAESDNAFGYLKQAYENAERVDNYEAMAFAVYNMIGDFSLSPRVLTYVNRYLKADIPSTVPTRPYVAMVCRGYSDYMNGDYKSAHRNFAAADTLSHVPKQLLSWFKSQAIYLDGRVYEAEGDRATAAEKFENLLADARERGDLESSMWMNGILYLFHTRGGNDALAEKYLFGYYKDRENIALENEGASISELDLLEKIDGYENRLSNTSGKGIFASGTPVWVYFVIIGALIVLVTLIAMLVRYRLRFRYVMRRYEEYMHDRKEESARPQPVLHVEVVERTAVDVPEEEPEKMNTLDLPDPDLIRRISEVMDGSDEVFNPEFQMSTLCTVVGSNPTYVSKALNLHYGKTFKSVLAERRVAKACRLLDNPVSNATLTIEAICHEVGFKSRGAFSVAFKNVVGITPTEYRKAALRYMPA